MIQTSNTTDVAFEGHSDDIFIAGGEEYYAPFNLLVAGDGGRLVVTARYGEREGVWNIGLEPVDEDIPIPQWSPRFCLAENGYSIRMVLSIKGKPTITQIAE